jgi:hypothetical protein
VRREAKPHTQLCAKVIDWTCRDTRDVSRRLGNRGWDSQQAAVSIQSSGAGTTHGQDQGQSHLCSGDVYQQQQQQQGGHQGPGHSAARGEHQDQGKQQYGMTRLQAWVQGALQGSQHQQCLMEHQAGGGGRIKGQQRQGKGRSRRGSSGRQPVAPKVAWSFRVPDGAVISFIDNCAGPQVGVGVGL